MTFQERTKLVRKFAALEKHLLQLDELAESTKSNSATDFANDTVKLAATERHLQIALEAMLDIAKLAIIDQHLPLPEENAEAVALLGKQSIIDATTAELLVPAAKFRNILVHQYVDVDPEKVYEYLHKHRNDLRRFASEIAAWMEKSR